MKRISPRVLLILGLLATVSASCAEGGLPSTIEISSIRTTGEAEFGVPEGSEVCAYIYKFELPETKTLSMRTFDGRSFVPLGNVDTNNPDLRVGQVQVEEGELCASILSTVQVDDWVDGKK